MKRPNHDHWKEAVKEEWTVEDWKDWYYAINRVLWKIAKRHQAPKSGTSVRSASSC